MEQAPKPAESPQAKGKKMWIALAAVVIIVVVVVAGLYYAGYLGMQSTGTPVSIFETTLGSCGSIATCNFNPASLTAKVNEKVTWTNNGQLPHTVTANSTANGSLPTFDSGNLDRGDPFSYTFVTAGTYKYYCNIHQLMKAEVIVNP
jgi:plastocyanin